MPEPSSVPENARGRVRTSSFWTYAGVKSERWRAGWWDAYDAKPPASTDPAYVAGRAEWIEYSAAGASSGEGSQRMTTTMPDTITVVDRPLSGLREHPRNPRSKAEESAAIAEMRDSIQRHGQMQPALVRTDGLVIAGHVRKWGREALGLTTMPCIEIDCDDATALALLLASNEHITPPDALLEAEAVEDLLHPRKPGAIAWSLQQVADALGRPVKWVARRAQLRNLSPKVRELMRAGKLLQGWPVDWLERIAILGISSQDELVGRWKRQPYELNGISSGADLDRVLADELHVLGHAPFDPFDPELVPKAGSCVAAADGPSCRKTTISKPGLFEDAVDGDPKTARCCDSICWVGKVKAHVAAEVEKAKATHGKSVVVVQPLVSRGHDAGYQALKGMDTAQPYNVTKCAGTVAGAKPALFVEGDGAVAHGFVRPAPGAQSSAESRGRGKAKAAPKEEKSDAERLKASREQIANRRMAHVVDAVVAAVKDPKTPTPEYQDVMRLVAAYEVKAPFHSSYSDHFHGDRKRAEKYAAYAELSGEFIAQLWARVRESVAASIARRGTAQIREEHELAEWIAERIGLDLAQLDVDALEAIPNPRWWPAAAEAPKKKKRATGKAAAAGDDHAADAGKKESTKARKKRNPWSGMSDAQRLERVNKIRTGKGLPPKAAL